MLKKTYKIALAGILLSLACGISWLEQIIPVPLPLGAKFGFSSVIIMFAIFRLDFKISVSITVLKSVFVFLIRGVTAFMMSISGGILSFFIMLLIYRCNKKISVIFLSTAGSVTHNIGQLICASVIMQIPKIFIYYSPVMIAVGIVSGIFTGITAKAVIKYTEKYKF